MQVTVPRAARAVNAPRVAKGGRVHHGAPRQECSAGSSTRMPRAPNASAYFRKSTRPILIEYGVVELLPGDGRDHSGSTIPCRSAYAVMIARPARPLMPSRL
jgi:hypothetical protein